MPGRIELRERLRADEPPADAVVVVRGDSDTIDKLRRHALRTARAWALDNSPLFGISVFAVVDRPLDALLRDRFATFRRVHLTIAGTLRGAGVRPAGDRPDAALHSAVGRRRRRRATTVAGRMGPARDNHQYGN